MRHLFGASLVDWTFGTVTLVGEDNVAQLSGGTTITMWNAETGGTRYTDLLDENETAVTQIISADGSGSRAVGTIPPFFGPDDVTEMWAEADGGPRAKIMATDLGEVVGDLDALSSDVDTLSSTVNGLAAVASSGAYSDLTGTPSLADVATSGEYGDLSGKPSAGFQYVVKAGDWPERSTTAPDTARPAMWIGTAPAPPAGGAYAIDGVDFWLATP